MTASAGDWSPRFDSVAANYSEIVDESIRFSRKGHDFFTRAKVDQLLALGDGLVGDLSDKLVLDVGCGNGATDTYLAPWVGQLYGVDVSPEMVTQARRRNPSVSYETYDGARLPFPDERFDLSFAICVMHHVPPAAWNRFVAELVRVTRHDGAVMVFEHNPLNPLTRRAVSNCAFDEDAVLLGPRQVSAAFERSGADVVGRRYILFTPMEARLAREAERFVSWLPLGAQYVVAARPTAGERRMSLR